MRRAQVGSSPLGSWQELRLLEAGRQLSLLRVWPFRVRVGRLLLAGQCKRNVAFGVS
jgi:hypothetical protein